jgi:RNA polymerase-binding transcription factor DksA
MASARKKSAPKAKPKVKRAAPTKAKPAAKKPAVKAKPVAKKPVAKVVGKPAVAGKKPLPAKLAAKPNGKPAAKAVTPARVIGKPAVPGKKPVPPPPPPPPAKPRIPKLVPATAEAKALAAAAARAGKSGAKGRASNRPEPEVRPLGVLPVSAQAKPRVPSPRPVGPSRPLTPPKGSPKQQPVRKGDDRLTPEDLKQFEQRLMEARARVMREMGHLDNTVLKVNPRDAAGELSGYSYHMADAGTDSMEREKAFDIASKEGRLLMEIDDALRRLYNGTYGICEVSGKPIGRARLEALPWARLSLEEQEKLEKEQRAGRQAPAAE